MAEYDLAGKLYYVRHGIGDGWRDVYAASNPGAQVIVRLAPGQVVESIERHGQGALRWYHVRGKHMDLLGGGPSSFRLFDGYIKEPADGTIDVLREVPVQTYEGVPSLLAQGDLIALADNYPGPGEGVYAMVPANESDPPTAGLVEAKDLAAIDGGPYRTQHNILYWHVRNVSGPEGGWVREAARAAAGARYQAKIRPYLLVSNR